MATCDGYAAPANDIYSWPRLLHVGPTTTQPAADAELRAFSFFRNVVAPVLAGPLNAFFWTHLVAQVAHQEQAARHAVLAISSLYEHFNLGTADCHLAEKNAFAVKHYNESIRQLRSTKSRETVLLVCILFTCIDMLRGEFQGAINHCRHGINIMNGARLGSSVVRDHLEPAFSRMGIFPFFFGARPETFPAVTAAKSLEHAPFRAVAEAQSALDPLIVQTIRFVRSADEYRLGIWTSEEPDVATLQERVDFDSALDNWATAFRTYQKQTPRCDRECVRTQMVELLLEMKWLVAKIWIDTCLSRGEMVYDLHLDKFRAITELARQAECLRRTSRDAHVKPKFTFEMGFGPLLAFVVIKCRSLKLRVEALGLMETLASGRESLWDNRTMLASGKRIIEVEHGLLPSLDENIENFADDDALPPEERRIQDSVKLNEEQTVTGEDGSAILRHKVAYLMRKPGESITVQDEWYSITA
ncbi:hypothetical protein ACHAQH_001966 [Verticillium albo-atrum]